MLAPDPIRAAAPSPQGKVQTEGAEEAQNPGLPGSSQLKRFFRSNAKLEVVDAALVLISGLIFALETIEDIDSVASVDLALRYTEDAIVIFFALEVCCVRTEGALAALEQHTELQGARRPHAPPLWTACPSTSCDTSPVSIHASNPARVCLCHFRGCSHHSFAPVGMHAI